MKKFSKIVVLVIAMVLVLGIASCKKKHKHTFDQMVATEAYLATEATCTKKATYYYSCECGEKDTRTFEYGELKAHNLETIPGKAATCTEPGLTDGSRCKDCGAVIVAQEEIPAGHKPEVIPAVEPTCTETGLTEGSKCQDCGHIIVAQEVIPAKGHTAVVIPAVEPTCTETGLTEGSKCQVCGAILVPQEVVPATGHDFVDDKCVNCGLAHMTEGLNFEYDATTQVYLLKSYTGTATTVRILPTYDDGTNGKHPVSLKIDSSKTANQVFNPANLTVAVEKVILEEGFTMVDEYAFYNSTGLNEVILPEGVTNIGKYAFYMSGIKSIELPESLTRINPYAFYESSLESVILPDDLQILGSFAFSYTKLKAINLPASLDSISTNPFTGCSELKEITSDSDKFYTADGAGKNKVIVNADSEKIITILPDADVEHMKFKTLNEHAFINRTSKVVLPSTLKMLVGYSLVNIKGTVDLSNLTDLVLTDTGNLQGSDLTELIMPQSITADTLKYFRTSDNENLTVKFVNCSYYKDLPSAWVVTKTKVVVNHTFKETYICSGDKKVYNHCDVCGENVEVSGVPLLAITGAQYDSTIKKTAISCLLTGGPISVGDSVYIVVNGKVAKVLVESLSILSGSSVTTARPGSQVVILFNGGSNADAQILKGAFAIGEDPSIPDYTAISVVASV